MWAHISSHLRKMGNLWLVIPPFLVVVIDQAIVDMFVQNGVFGRDFSVFADTIEYCGRGLAAEENTQKAVRDNVLSCYEQALVESVLGMRALHNAKDWSDRDIDKALSSEALTAAVMQRYHIITFTRDALRRKRLVPQAEGARQTTSEKGDSGNPAASAVSA